MTEMTYEERRHSRRAARMWWAVKTPGRIARFNRWRKTPTEVTRGFLVFRDVIVIGFCGGIVLAGVTTVRALREEDCERANEIRANAAVIASADVDSDERIWDAIDTLVEGIPEPARSLIFGEMDDRRMKIEATYAEQPCPA